MNDINMTTSAYKDDFLGIPTFSGTLNGNHKKIIGLVGKTALFNTLTDGAKIKNLEFDNLVMNSGTGPKAAALAISISAGNVTIDNVNVDNNSEVTSSGGGYYFGGLIATSDGNITIINCQFHGTVTSSANTVGGLIASSNGTITLENSFVDGTINGNSTVGGLVGYANTGTIKKSYSSGTIKSANGQAGGLVGSSGITEIDESHTTANITGSRDIGGLIGFDRAKDNLAITNSYSTGTITGKYEKIGGLIGETNSTNITIKNTYSSSAVSVTSSTYSSYIGGFIGNVTKAGTVLIENGYSNGSVTTLNSFAGLVIGYSKSNTTISNFFVSGSMSGNVVYQGAVIGGNDGMLNINNLYVSGALTNSVIVSSTTGGGVLNNVYWIGETTGVSKSTYGTLISTNSDSKKKSSYNGFDFDTIWAIKEGTSRPYLRNLPIPNSVY